LHHPASHLAWGGIGGVGFQKFQDISLGCRIKAGVLAEMLIEAAHHAPPGCLRQHRWCVGDMAARAFLLPVFVRQPRQDIAAVITVRLAGRQRKRQQADCSDRSQYADPAQ